MGLRTAPRRQRDSVVKVAMMAVRLGSLTAVVLGVGMAFALWPVNLAFHMMAGVLTLGGVWIVALRTALGRLPGLPLAGAAALLGLGGAWAGFGAMGGQLPAALHWTTMLVTVGLAEAGAARAGRP